MPKKAYKIEDFSGGINQLADPRDIEDNQFEELFNADVSRIGRITLPGNALEPYQTTNVENNVVSPDNSSFPFHISNTNQGLTPGYGLFSFNHDFNMRSLLPGTGGSQPKEQNTEFLCLNDGAHIDIWDSCHFSGGQSAWLESVIKLGEAHTNSNESKIKPTYYMAGNGLRVCDGQFSEKDTDVNNSGTVTATATTITAGASVVLNKDEYIRINNEIMKVTADSTGTSMSVKRAQFGTTATAHTNSSIIRINVPKVLTHINRPMLEKSGANVNINRWVEDIQAPEKPDPGALKVFNVGVIGSDAAETTLSANSFFPDNPEQVFLGIDVTSDTNSAVLTLHNTAIDIDTTDTETVVTLTLADPDNPGTAITNASRYQTQEGKFFNASVGLSLMIDGVPTANDKLNGIHEIVGFESGGKIKIICDDPGSYTPTANDGVSVRVEEELASDDLKNEYVFGMSYLYQGGGNEIQESDITIAHSATQNSNFKIDSHIFNNSTWKTSNSSFGSETALDIVGADSYTASNSWKIVHTYDHALQHEGNTESFLFVDDSNQTVTTNTKYTIELTTESMDNASHGDTLIVFVGVGNTDGITHGDLVEGVGKKTITTNGTHKFHITTSSSSVDSNNIIVLNGNASSSDSSFIVKRVSMYETTVNTVEMSASDAIDFRGMVTAGQAGLTFLCNNSRTASAQNNSWNERIEGFKIYMKQVDAIGGGLAEDFLLLYDVNLKTGEYVCHATDTSINNLQLTNIASNEWSATNTADNRAYVSTQLSLDSLNSLPFLSYESENGYSAGTNLAAMYKTSTTIQRKVYIGNLKIGNRTYPDRMMRADADKFDTFPDDGTHFIDVATADGDSIVKLESFGDNIIQYKEKTAFLIKVTTEGEDLLETWQGAGVLSPSQVVKTNKGVVWVNSNGLYLYDGEKLSQVSEDRFKSEEWSINENKETPVILGYHENSNKVIIQTLNNTATNSGGFIYDLSTGAIIQCQKLFKWYISQSVDNLDVDTVTGNPKVSPPLIVTDGEGPLA